MVMLDRKLISFWPSTVQGWQTFYVLTLRGTQLGHTLHPIQIMDMDVRFRLLWLSAQKRMPGWMSYAVMGGFADTKFLSRTLSSQIYRLRTRYFFVRFRTINFLSCLWAALKWRLQCLSKKFLPIFELVACSCCASCLHHQHPLRPYLFLLPTSSSRPIQEANNRKSFLRSTYV